MLFGDFADLGELALAGAGKEDVDVAFFLLDGGVEAVEVGEAGGIAHDAGDIFADALNGCVELGFVAAGDEDVGAFCDKEFGGGEGHAGGGGGDDGHFSIELTHDATH